jgi:leader peptidase (prepilin peptidase) / N-methyltransferase
MQGGQTWGAPGGGMAVLEVVMGITVLGAAGAVGGAGARVLLGRLRRGARVPPPWCELAGAALWAATGVAWVAGALPAGWLPAVLGLGWLAVAAAAVDLRHRRLPNALTVPALPVALLLLLPVGPAAVVRGAGGAALAAAVHVAVHLVDRRAVGAGDVKLAAPLGAVLAAVAWPALAFAAVLATLLTGAVAGQRLWADARAGSAAWWGPTGRSVPHGPSMLAATWLVTVALLALGAGGAGGE